MIAPTIFGPCNPTTLNSDELWMEEALRAGQRALQAGEVPVGAVVVCNETIVGRGWNRNLTDNDPTAHAEIIAIRAACASLGTFQLDGSDLYTTCEPCPMCLGAIYWARLRQVFFGATADDAAAAGFDDAFIYRQIALAPAQRKIPFVTMMRDDALACFKAWEAKADRVHY